MSKILTAKQAAKLSAQTSSKSIIERQFKEIMQVIEAAAYDGQDEIGYAGLILEENVYKLVALGYLVDADYVFDTGYTFVSWREY